MQDPNNTTPLEVAISLVELKLRHIDELPEEEKELLQKLIGAIAMLPHRYKTGSENGYYKAKYALQVKNIFDRINTDPEHKRLLVDAMKLGQAKNTVQQRMFLAKTFLLEKLDPEGIYAELAKRIKIRRHVKGVAFEWQRDDSEMFEVDELGDAERPDVSWRDKFDLFLIHATEGSQLELQLALTDNELLELKSMLWDVKDKFVPLAVHKERLLLRCDSVLAKAAKGEDV